MRINTKPTSWFAFGQAHVHRVDGITFDRDIVVEINADDPREIMLKAFGKKWAMEYGTQPDMRYFPRGVVEWRDNKFVHTHYGEGR